MSGATSARSRPCPPPASEAGGPWRRATAASFALHAAIAAWLVMDWHSLPEPGGAAPAATLAVEWAPSQGEPDGADEAAAEAETEAPPTPDLAAAVAVPAPAAPQPVSDGPLPPVIVPVATPAPPPSVALAVPPPPLPPLAMAMPPVAPPPIPASAPTVTAPEPPPAPDPIELAEAEPVTEAPTPAIMEQPEQAERVEALPTPPPPLPPPQQVASATPAPRAAASTPAPHTATPAPAAHRPRRGTPYAAHQVAARGPAVAAASGAAVAPPEATASGPLVIHAPRYRLPPRPPQYPARALDLGITGTVMVRALVSADGDTQETRIWRSSGHPLLDAAAIAAVRRWAFEPARHGGRPVPAWVEVPVHFRLNRP